MFLRSNVVKMKWTRIVILRKLTIFATAVRSFPDLLTSRRRHIYSVPFPAVCFNDNRAFA